MYQSGIGSMRFLTSARSSGLQTRLPFMKLLDRLAQQSGNSSKNGLPLTIASAGLLETLQISITDLQLGMRPAHTATSEMMVALADK